MTHRTRILEPMPTAQADLYQQMLVREGIEAEVVGGDLPGTYARLLVPDEQVELAQVALAEAEAAAGQVVQCPACDRENPGTFVDCWNCGASLEGDGSDRQEFAPDEGGSDERAGPWAWVVTVLVLLLIFAWYARWFSVGALLD